MTTTEKHKPGKWNVAVERGVAGHGSYAREFLICDEEHRPVAVVRGNNLEPDAVSIGDARRNAVLVAAAPELLDLLSRASEADSQDEDVRTAWWEARRAALSKAEPTP